MLSLLKDYKGSLEINGIKYNSVSDAIKRFKSDGSKITIKLFNENRERNTEQTERKQRKIFVKQYMTRKASEGFDFMKQWNNDNPMPLRTMIGTVEKETNGMVYMKLHADITSEKTMRCLACGRPITNPVSQYFGMGPECSGHKYINPFYSEEELKKAVQDYRENVLKNITWEGWIIKTAVISEEDIDYPTTP